MHLVAGTRADFVKLVPLARAAMAGGELEHQLVDAGCLDPGVANTLLEELGVPQPAVRLAVDAEDGGDLAGQVAAGYRGLCRAVRPSAVIVAGGSDAAVGCARVARKLSIAVVQAEAGLRFGGPTPGQGNRTEVDQLADWRFVSDDVSARNLVREGHAASSIHGVGSLVVDNLFHVVEAVRARPAHSLLVEQVRQVVGGRYAVVALRHSRTVSDATAMGRIAAALRELSAELPVVVSVSPSTRASLEGVDPPLGAGVVLLRQLGTAEFVSLWERSALVLTDSSCLQAETSALGVPCVTLGEATDRQVTLHMGTNVLAGTETARVLAHARQQLGRERGPCRIPLWDGRAAARIATIVARGLASVATGT